MNFNYQNTYPTIGLPLFARNVVATSHPLAAQAGLTMLLQGGNAVDAAIAAAAALTITEPVSNGLGSDAFCILWDGAALHGLNASGRAPQAWTPDYFRSRYGQDAATPPQRGIDSVTVPGAVSAWTALSQRFGKLPFAELMTPAIELAERGYCVPPVVQRKWVAAQMLGNQPGFVQTFLPRGRAPEVGEVFTFPAAARALRSIAQSAGASFYNGDIAQAIVNFSAQHGGALSLADLAAHRCDWVTPIAKNYRGYTLHEIPPNGQGIAALLALGMLEHFDLGALPVDGVEARHLQIEAMKLAFADVYRFVSDPTSMEVSVAQMLDTDYLAARARLIDPRRAQEFKAGSPADAHRRGGTVYLTAADASGMMVSFIQSNYQGFGSGCVEPTFGISLQNRGFGFSLKPDSPNLVAPGKRPFHTIIPAFLTKDGQPVMSFGVMGANMQPQGHLQTLVRMLDHGQNPQMACDAPRWRFNAGREINVEPTMTASTVQGLIDLGHQAQVSTDVYQDFGAGQFIWRTGDPATQGYIAASDARRDGQAVGF
jgi:gamma-glutamyltranspeptidase / glutathione hydrolase